jgi:predicted oxidoreductase
MEMEKLRTHLAGPALSRIVAGTWRWQNIHSEQIEILINTALECGITTFDHADIYGKYTCEEKFGNVLRDNSSLRNRIELITKCGIKLISEQRPEHRVKHYDTSAKHIEWSVDNSLKKLATDRIDLLLLHRPDPLMNPQEVAEVFTMLKQKGKVLHFGVSNFTAIHFEMLQSYLPFPLATNQVEISLYKNQPLFDGTVDVLMKHKVRPMAWSPLGGGKHFDDSAIGALLSRLGRKYETTPIHLLLAWLLKHPSQIIPILGTTKPERIQEAAKSITIELDKQHWFEMLKSVTGTDVA